MIMMWVLRAKHLFDISEKSAISSVRAAELISFGCLVNEKNKISIILEGYKNFGQLYRSAEFIGHYSCNVSTQLTYSLLQSLQYPPKPNSINLNAVGTYSSETSERRVLQDI